GVESAVGGCVVLVQHRIERVNDVLGSARPAVVEGDTLTQFEGEFGGVLVEVPGGSEARLEAEAAIEHYQRLHDGGDALERAHVGGHSWVEVIGFASGSDYQALLSEHATAGQREDGADQ